ncbi:MAG TPA: hypothetical protein VG204_03450 [Terriglobia bacterium]|nr:hypothetical protein [Terriglobia bacterium]
MASGSRIVAGQLPYRDFFEELPVGTDLTYALLIRLFGLYTWIPGLVMACLAAAVVLVMTAVAARLMHGPVIILPGLLLVGFVLYASLDATHHWFSTLAALAAMLVLLDGLTPKRVAAAGALCGLAACFTQTAGAAAVAGLVTYLIWNARRRGVRAREWLPKCLLLSGAAAGVFAVVNVYFIRAVGLGRWLFCVVIYPVRYFHVPDLNNWRIVEHDFWGHPGLSRWVSFPFLYATVPLVYVIFALTFRSREKAVDEPWDRLVLVALTGVALFITIAPSPSVKRLSCVSPPAIILVAWLLNRPGKLVGMLRTGLGGVAIGLVVAASLYRQTRWRAYLDLPGGRTAFSDQVTLDEYRWMLAHTHPGQYFFGMPPMLVPFHLVNPTAVVIFDTSEYTRPEWVVDGVQALKTHPVPLMVLNHGEQYLLSTHLPSDHNGPFRDYWVQNYRLTKTFPNGDEVWGKIDLRGGTSSSRPVAAD